MSIYSAKWVRERSDCESPVFHKRFSAKNIKRAHIDVCGLGWFELFLNGQAVSDALFAPAHSNYNDLSTRRFGYYPFSDKFVSPRVYFCRFDLTDLIKNGENLLSAHLGNGYFNQHSVNIAEADFHNGAPRLIFSLTIEKKDGQVTEIDSDTSVRAGKSHILLNNLYDGEYQDLELLFDFHSPEYDDSHFGATLIANAPDGELTLFEYPYDRVIRKITPRLIARLGSKDIYDLGENISGRIVFATSSDKKITLEHAEEIYPNGELDFTSLGGRSHVQRCVYVGDGRRHVGLCPHFSWQGFRYFSVVGEIENPVCEVIHTDLERTGDFICGSDIINTVFDMYLRTQANNIHGCVPFDCPHIERKGYTGDGQITSETVMHVFDARKFYKKWMQDIADCQSRENGHVQNTAPFLGGGGGPAGWGGAAVVLPYNYYKMYGDADFVRKFRDCAVNYLSYMETLSEGGIITHGEAGQWCLGDWCFEGCTSNGEQEIFPNAYVNTALLVKFYEMMLKLDADLDLGIDRELYSSLKAEHEAAIISKYFDRESGDFCKNVNGANAFALDIGLGDERTFKNLCEKYENLGGFDTGIFGTEILIRQLGERGRADLVYRLLSSKEKDRSFYSMHERGATTLWEYFHGLRSHSHPMFGGCMKALFTVFLGIKPQKAGYSEVLIEPADIPELKDMSGYITTPKGKLSVALERGDILKFAVDIPQGVKADFRFGGKQIALSVGKNEIIV